MGFMKERLEVTIGILAWSSWEGWSCREMGWGRLDGRLHSSRGSSQPRDQTCISYTSCLGRQVLYHWHHLGSPSVLWVMRIQ